MGLVLLWHLGQQVSARVIFLSADIADLAQAQAVLVRQQTARKTVSTFLFDLQVAQLAHEVIRLRNFQGDTGKTLDQALQGLWRQ